MCSTEKINETTERVSLTGWGSFIEVGSGVKALLFGEMVKRAIPVVEEYLSDLFHDAMWVDNIDGPVEFEFLVRPSGTNLGQSARMMRENTSLWQKGGVSYGVRVFPRQGMWYADFITLRDDRPRCSTCSALLVNEDCPNYGDGPEHAGATASTDLMCANCRDAVTRDGAELVGSDGETHCPMSDRPHGPAVPDTDSEPDSNVADGFDCESGDYALSDCVYWGWTNTECAGPRVGTSRFSGAILCEHHFNHSPSGAESGV